MSFASFSGVHVFGLCITALITDIIQLATGYHAPYFLTVCKPNYTSLNTSCDENSFIVDDICSGPDPAAINAGRSESGICVILYFVNPEMLISSHFTSIL